MARIRGIKPDFFRDEDLATLPFGARLFFAGLLTHVDREGRIEYRPKRLKVDIMPYDDINIEEICGLLNSPKISNRPEKRFILIYESNKQQYIQVLNFLKHQRPHHLEKPSTIPAPDVNLLKIYNTCQTPSLSGQTPLDNGHKPDGDGINPPVPCSLFLESGRGECSLPPGFNSDKINSDTPLPPILQAEWDRLLEVYPGNPIGKDKAIRLFVKSAERARIIRNAGHFARSEMARDGKVFALDRFVAESFRDFDEPPEKPLGRATAETGRDWKKELDRDSQEADADRKKVGLDKGTVKRQGDTV